MRREIDSRTNTGISVTLEVEFVCDVPRYGIVKVESAEDNFILGEIPLDKCSDVYFHPYAYAHSMLASGRMERVA